MLRIFGAFALLFSIISISSVSAHAGGWSGGERDLIIAPFKRGYTLETVWLRLGSRR